MVGNYNNWTPVKDIKNLEPNTYTVLKFHPNINQGIPIQDLDIYNEAGWCCEIITSGRCKVTHVLTSELI